MLSAVVRSVGTTSTSAPRSAITALLVAPGLAPTGRVSQGRGSRVFFAAPRQFGGATSGEELDP